MNGNLYPRAVYVLKYCHMSQMRTMLLEGQL